MRDWANELVRLKPAILPSQDWVVAANNLYKAEHPSVEWIQINAQHLMWMPQINGYLANAANLIGNLRAWAMQYGMPRDVVFLLFGERVLLPNRIDWPHMERALKSRLKSASAAGNASEYRLFASAWRHIINPNGRFIAYWDETTQQISELPDVTGKRQDVLAVVKILQSLGMPATLAAFFVFPSQRPRTDMHFIERILQHPFPTLPVPPGSTAAMFLNPNTFVAPSPVSSIVVDETLQNSGTVWLQNTQTGVYIAVLRYIEDLLEDEEKKAQGQPHLIECGQFFDFEENYESMRPASASCMDVFCGTFYYFDGDSPFLLRAKRVLVSRNKYTASMAVYNHPELMARQDLKKALYDSVQKFKQEQWAGPIRDKMIPFQSVEDIERQLLDASYYQREDLFKVNGFIAPFDHSLDQPLCWAARYLGIDVILLTSMADVNEKEIGGLVTEVMDIRPKLESYGSLFVDKRFLDPFHPPRTLYDQPQVGLHWDYPNAFSDVSPAAVATIAGARRRRSIGLAMYPPYTLTTVPQLAAATSSSSSRGAPLRMEVEVGVQEEPNTTRGWHTPPLVSGLLAQIGMGLRPLFATTLVGLEGSLEYKFGSAGDELLRTLNAHFPSIKQTNSPPATNMFIIKTIVLAPEYRQKGIMSLLLQAVCMYANVDAILIESVTNIDWLRAMKASGKFWTMPGNDTNVYYRCR